MFQRDQGYQNPSIIIIIIKSMGPAYKRTLFTTINWSHCLAHELIAEFTHYKLMWVVRVSQLFTVIQGLSPCITVQIY